MKIIVAGCGKIGRAITSTLTAEGHGITVIDNDPDVIGEVTNIYDVMGVCGNGADCETLEEAGIAQSDLFIAVTSSDELNMLACFLAKRMGVTHTIARIRNPEYNDNSLGFMKNELELSMAINPDLLAAEELFDILKLPSVAKIESFSARNFKMIELVLKSGSKLAGLSLRELREKYKSKVLICLVKRGDEVYIPDGNFVLREGDKTAITAAHEDILRFLREIGLVHKQARNIMIVGGSRTAFYLAKMLGAAGVNVKIVERDEKVCGELCEVLPHAVIICGDGAEQEILLEEGIRSLDAFVALTGMDEENILISIYATLQNVPKVISNINREGLSKMAERLGLDTTVSPQKIIADVIARYARAVENSKGSNVETLYKLMDDAGEALEFNAKDDPRLVRIPLRDLKLKPNTLLAGIIRKRRPIVPAGDDMILPGDRVIVLSATAGLHDLSDIIK